MHRRHGRGNLPLEVFERSQRESPLEIFVRRCRIVAGEPGEKGGKPRFRHELGCRPSSRMPTLRHLDLEGFADGNPDLLVG